MTNPFACELRHSYNPISKAWEAAVALKMEAGDESRALLREAPDKIWRTLSFVALRMEPTGRCYVTDVQIAQDMGITRAQAAKRLKELSEWEYQGRKILSADGEGYYLSPDSGNPSFLFQVVPCQEESSLDQAKADELPTTQDLIRELTRKLHKVPGVQVQKGNYSLIGRALNSYGYEAVSEAIDDISFEFDLRDQLGQAPPTNREFGQLLMQRSAWNAKSLDSQTKGSRAKEDLWTYYGWNEAGNQLVPSRPDPPFAATVIGGKIVITKKGEVEN